MKQKKAIKDALFGLGYTVWDHSNPKDWSKPSITVQEQLNAICKHLGIFVVKTPTTVSVKKETLPRRSTK